LRQSLPGAALLTAALPTAALVLILAACAPATPAPLAPSPTPSPTPFEMECTILPYALDVYATMSAFIDESAHVRGPQDAPVTMLVFTDFQCSGCAVLADAITQVQADHPDDLRLIVRYLPDTGDKSLLAMQAAEAAHLQGMFWEMYTLLFTRQPEWYALAPADFTAWLGEQADALGLDAARFLSDMSGEEVQARLQAVIDTAATLTLSPPLLYLNSTSPYSGMADASSLDQMVRLAMLEADKFHTCPRWVVDPQKEYLATLDTTRGEVVLQLFPQKAPLAVNNFIFLARAGWYDGITFHRTEAGFVIQTGDPSATGYGNPGYYFSSELAPDLTFDTAGMLAMANVGQDTNGSQFFINLASTPQLNGQFTIFGQVLSGLEVLQSLSAGEALIHVTIDER
jgi:cyclophilin family peptidyl-prolyl cis-trans isomerase/protein-disulfide isomerase